MAKLMLLGGTFCPCEAEIESGIYIDLDEIRKDPLRKRLDPARMTKCQCDAAMIPYGSSTCCQRREKKPQKVLTGCAAKRFEEKNRNGNGNGHTAHILRRRNGITQRIAVSA